MDEKLKAAIEKTLAMIPANVKADDALKYSQAALNLAQVKQIMASKYITKGAGA